MKGRSEANLWKIWSEYKDVAHLVAAAILLTAEAEARNRAEGWSLGAHEMAPYHVIMMAPEGVLFGLKLLEGVFGHD